MRLTTVALLAVLLCACSAHQFVQVGRKTILTVEEANSALDDVATEFTNDPAHDDPKYDKAVDSMTCAIIITDDLMLAGWKILNIVDLGPPKLSLDDSERWYVWAAELIGHLATVYHIMQAFDLRSEPFEDAFDALGKFAPMPDLATLPDELNCAEVSP